MRKQNNTHIIRRQLGQHHLNIVDQSSTNQLPYSIFLKKKNVNNKTTPPENKVKKKRGVYNKTPNGMYNHLYHWTIQEGWTSKDTTFTRGRHYREVYGRKY